MNHNATIRIVLYSIAIVLLVALLVAGLAVTRWWNNWGAMPWEYTIDGLSDGIVSSTGTAPAGEIQTIEISWAAGVVTVQSGPVEEITFRETEGLSTKAQLVWKQSGSLLQIQFRRAGIFFSSWDNATKKDLIITVPETWEGGTLKISGAAVDVTAQGLRLRRLELDTAAGQVDCNDCTVGAVALDSAASDLSYTGSLETLDANTMSGNCYMTIVGGQPRRLELDSMSGDLVVTFPESMGFTATMSSMSGSFSSEYPTSASGGKYVYGDGSCALDVDTMSGDLQIQRLPVSE